MQAAKAFFQVALPAAAVVGSFSLARAEDRVVCVQLGADGPSLDTRARFEPAGITAA